MASDIKLHGDKADRFEEIKTELTGELEYEPTNSEVVGLLMAQIDVGTVSGLHRRSDDRNRVR